VHPVTEANPPRGLQSILDGDPVVVTVADWKEAAFAEEFVAVLLAGRRRRSREVAR
jgi:hypothetical protein